jgi:ankyrin repeat protein
VELTGVRPYTLPDGEVVTTEDVFQTFVAARDGDLTALQVLVGKAPGLAIVEYNYTPPLHFAVREGHLALVEFLIGRGADLAYRSYPFHDAYLTIAEDRQHHEVADMLRTHLARRFALGNSTRAIIAAAESGDLARVQSELARDPSLARASNETGDTPLHHAAARGHVDIARVLLAAGADADAVRGDGYRPIHLALATRAGVGADVLLAHSARYTMYLAALRGDIDHVRRALLGDRSLANEEDTNHHRPLSAAARRQDLAMSRLLLDHGANPSLPEEGAPRGHALWLAVHHRQRELARWLLEHGADPNGMVESSGTPMMQARGDAELEALLAAYGGHEDRGPHEQLGRLIDERRLDEVEAILAANPAMLHDPQHGWGDGVMAGPANNGDHEVLAMLVRLGAVVPPVSKWAPYYYFKHEATARWLLEHGMDANHMNWHRFTLLHHMAAEGELGKARLLVAHGADLHAIDDEYSTTPLGAAARRGQRALVAFLLERGADPTLAAATWATPLEWARRKGHADVVALLEGHS